MKLTIDSIKIQYFLLYIFLGITQIALGDNIQESLNLDYFRTPEASAFKRYGETSVNEYTGTADISVPLYTIKCKDIEIPLVLRYDASGIKVEQEASWVGLGWNLMIGGCINYVSAGGTDLNGQRIVPNPLWTEYLTSEFGPWTAGSAVNGGVVHYDFDPFSEEFNSQFQECRTRYKYYNYQDTTTTNWMSTIPYYKSFAPPYIDQFGGNTGQSELKDYIDYGFGERDFYSVNVLGKTFKFFIDPFTLNIYPIGQAGENFKVETYPVLEHRGITLDKEPIEKWIITDSDGYVYYFAQSDRIADTIKSWYFYNSCWYLTEIHTPRGEKVKLSYTEFTKYSRSTRSESQTITNAHYGGQVCCGTAYPSGYHTVSHQARITSHYLSKIETGHQTIVFNTSESSECSGKKLNSISIHSNDNDSTEIKTINFTYGSFGYSNIGGNYAPATNATEELRLRLDNVKEIASSDTLTTCFSYNSLNLPSKRSCAQDFWGYYNGRENAKGIGHTLIPTPQPFMSSHYYPTVSNHSFIGADRYTQGSYMQAAMLNKIEYPTGGYTTYEFEPNSITVGDITLSDMYRKKEYDVSILSRYSSSPSPDGRVIDRTDQRKEFELLQETSFDLLLEWDIPSNIFNKVNVYVELCKQGDDHMYNQIRKIPINNLITTPYTMNFTLSPGNYYLAISVSESDSIDNGYYARCYLKGWNEETLANRNYTMSCGGLRIKQINNFDLNGTRINYSTYDYTNNGKTTGKLLERIETIDFTTYYNFNPIGGLPGTHTVEVFTLNTGTPRMPAFFASCNPGIVGYSRVTKQQYDANDNLEKSVVTSFINHEPMNMVIDYYDCLDNGQIQSQKIYEPTGEISEKTEYQYTHDRIHYATNMVAKDKGINAGGNNSNGVVTVWRYPYILSRTELAKTETTEYCPDSTTIVSTKEYSYNDINHQVSQIDESTSVPDQIRRTRITYTADGTDNISRTMRDSYHRLNNVVETKVALVENNSESCISTQHTDYIINGLPNASSMSIGNNPLETRTTYTYDGKSNIQSVNQDGRVTIYIWSYNGQYPIAKIEGITFDDLAMSLGQIEDYLSPSEIETMSPEAINNTIKSLGRVEISKITDKTDPDEILEAIDFIRQKVSEIGGYTTTYTYKPLIGMTSMTLPNGTTTRYEYDGSGRLTRVIDHNGSVISTNSYNYRNNGYE